MKNLKNCTLVTLLLATSCQPEAITTKTNEWEYIGVQHNEGLRYVLKELQRHRGASLSLEEALSINEKAGLSFILSQYPDLTNDEIESLKKETHGIHQLLCKTTSFSPGRSKSLSAELMAQAAPYLSSNQQNFINEVLYVMETHDDDIVQLQANLTTIENNVLNSLPAEELPVVLTAIGVARNSANFWNENYLTYEAELQQVLNINSFEDPAFSPRGKGDVHWGVVGSADVAAAVIAGVSTSVAVVVPFVGWAFWGAVTGGSAVITSGAAIIMYLAS